MQDQISVSGDNRQRKLVRDPMLAVLGAGHLITDSEALAVLRRRFPETSLCERVDAVARWRRG